MKPSERTYIFYLEDMLMSIKKIERYTLDIQDFHALEEDTLRFDAVIRNLEIIGEAAKNIPQEIKLQNPEIAWEDMYRTRNIVSHHYFGIDTTIIWHIIKHHLPLNKLLLGKLLHSITENLPE